MTEFMAFRSITYVDTLIDIRLQRPNYLTFLFVLSEV